MPVNLNGNIISSSSITSGVFANTIVTSGLVCYLDAGNKNSYSGSGTTWTDLSGYNNNGTLINGVGFTTDGGGGLTLDGGSQYISVPQGNFNLCSVIYVAKLNPSPNSRNTIFAQYYSGTGPQFEIGNTGSIRSGFRQNSASTPENDAPTNGNAVSTSTFFHVAVTHNTSASSIIKHYVNGNIIGQGTNSTQTDVNGAGAINIGRNPDAGLYFKGSVHIVMVYNRVLNNAEILANYYAIKSRFGI